jgi:hypothetical protein
VTTIKHVSVLVVALALGCASTTPGGLTGDAGTGQDGSIGECQEGAQRVCYSGPEGTAGVGTCVTGTQTCTGGQWGECVGEVAPVAGDCDVLSCAGTANPGCDCVIGETRYCYDGPAGTESNGICKRGTQLCAESAGGGVATWGECRGQKLPETEQCDGLDHDCDGVLNNAPGGCECEDGAVQNCYDGPAGTEGQGTCQHGTQECLGGAWGECTGQVTPVTGDCANPSCAGGPNPGCGCVIGDTQSCYTGAPQTLGVGICVAGTATCQVDGSGAAWGPCNGERTPEEEQCDGLDHDCNATPNDRAGGCTCSSGDTQPCYSGPAGTAGLGTCAAGTQSCVLVNSSYTWGPCEGEVAPVTGDCDHASCLGTGVPNPGCSCVNGDSRPCYTGTAGTSGVGTCHDGTQTCANGTWGSCLNQVTPAQADSCVPPNATYTAASDLTCNGTLDRHAPAAAPYVTGTSAAVITPLPAGMTAAVTSRPLDTLTLHGAAVDAEGGSFSYRWHLLSAPTGNTAGLSGAPGLTPADYTTQQNPTLFAQLAGDYLVGVVARDSTGCDSAEAQVLVRVKPHSSIHLQLTWDNSVDFDLQLVQGSTTPFFGLVDGDTCYWGDKVPDWGTVKPTLDVDDVAGCNPENINYGVIGGEQAPLSTYYGIYVHYYCNRRGHRPSLTDPDVVCYEPTSVSGAVTATLRIFVDGVPAKIDGSLADAVYAHDLTVEQTWKPAILYYDATGVWRVMTVNEPLGSAGTSSTCIADATCVCGSLANNDDDPYCGTSGAGCRQTYP